MRERKPRPRHVLRRLAPAAHKLHAHRLDGAYGPDGGYILVTETPWWQALSRRDRAAVLVEANRLTLELPLPSRKPD